MKVSLIRRLSCAVLIGLILGIGSFAAPQISARATPEVLIPYGNDLKLTDGTVVDIYGLGGGGDLTVDLPLFGFFSPYAEVGGGVITLNKVDNRLSFGHAGAGLSLFVYPIPRLMARLGGSGGMTYLGLANTTSSSSSSTPPQGFAPYWQGKLELGVRFTPGFSLLLNGGYTQIVGSDFDPIYKGISAGLVVNFSIGSSASGSSSIDTKVLKQETIYPITYYKSEKTPIGYAQIRNIEASEIRDVKVTFNAGAYTSRDASCGEVPVIQRGKSVELPIYANFNEKVLGFSETTKLQGELKIQYKVLDATRTSSNAITVVFYNRNTATWADERMVGAFISPQDPAMLELSKYIAGLVRVHSRTEIDKNLQYGMGLFEGLRVYGIVQTPDPNIPYKDARADTSKLAYVQYPYQTLSYKSGDSDAIALTVAEALVSVAVPAAISALPEDVIVAFPLDMPEAQARTTFSKLQNFIFDGGKVWVPLRASMIRDGFLRAWQSGADLWRAHEVDKPKLLTTDDAWKEYQPLSLADVDFKPVKPAEEQVNLAFENVLGRFVADEVEPKIQRLMADIKGEPTGRQLNSLGIVYAQYGLYDQARAQFVKAVAKDYSPAIVNLANIAFLLKDYEAAAAYFQKALDAQPTNKAAMIGLARAKYELDNYAEADDLFSRVKTVDPSLANQYSYLASKVDVGTALRASSAAADRGGSMTWDKDTGE
jgi:Tfp pilus assembly protein PilF